MSDDTTLVKQSSWSVRTFRRDVISVYATSTCNGFVLISLAEHFKSSTPIASRPWWSSVALCHKVQFWVPVFSSYIRRTWKTQLQHIMWDSTSTPMTLDSTSSVTRRKRRQLLLIHSRRALLMWLPGWIWTGSSLMPKKTASLGWVQIRFCLTWQQWILTPAWSRDHQSQWPCAFARSHHFFGPQPR